MVRTPATTKSTSIYIYIHKETYIVERGSHHSGQDTSYDKVGLKHELVFANLCACNVIKAVVNQQ